MMSLDQWDWKTTAPEFVPSVQSTGKAPCGDLSLGMPFCCPAPLGTGPNGIPFGGLLGACSPSAFASGCVPVSSGQTCPLPSHLGPGFLGTSCSQAMACTALPLNPPNLQAPAAFVGSFASLQAESFQGGAMWALPPHLPSHDGNSALTCGSDSRGGNSGGCSQNLLQSSSGVPPPAMQELNVGPLGGSRSAFDESQQLVQLRAHYECMLWNREMKLMDLENRLHQEEHQRSLLKTDFDRDREQMVQHFKQLVAASERHGVGLEGDLGKRVEGPNADARARLQTKMEMLGSLLQAKGADGACQVRNMDQSHCAGRPVGAPSTSDSLDVGERTRVLAAVEGRLQDLERNTGSSVDEQARQALVILGVEGAIEAVRRVQELVNAQGGRCRNLSCVFQSACRRMRRRNVKTGDTLAHPSQTLFSGSRGEQTAKFGWSKTIVAEAALSDDEQGPSYEHPRGPSREPLTSEPSTRSVGQDGHRGVGVRKGKGGYVGSSASSGVANLLDRRGVGSVEARGDRGNVLGSGTLRPGRFSTCGWSTAQFERLSHHGGWELTQSDKGSWELKIRMSRLDPPLTDESMQVYCRWFHQGIQRSRELCGMRSLKQVRAEVDFSKNGLSDDAVGRLLQVLQRSELHVSCLNLFGNCLGAVAAEHLADFIRGASYPLKELHLAHNRFDEDAVLEVASAFADHPRCRRAEARPIPTPIWLRLNNNWVVEPRRVWRRVHTLCGQAGGVCLARDRRLCGSSFCAQGRGASSPLLHLYMFEVQDQPPAARSGADRCAAAAGSASTCVAATSSAAGSAASTAVVSDTKNVDLGLMPTSRGISDRFPPRSSVGQSRQLWRPGGQDTPPPPPQTRPETPHKHSNATLPAEMFNEKLALVGTSMVASALRRTDVIGERPRPSVSFKEEIEIALDNKDMSKKTDDLSMSLSPRSASSSSSEETIGVASLATMGSSRLPAKEITTADGLEFEFGVGPLALESNFSAFAAASAPLPGGDPEQTPEPEVQLKDVFGEGVGKLDHSEVMGEASPDVSSMQSNQAFSSSSGQERRGPPEGIGSEIRDVEDDDTPPAPRPAKLLAPPRILQRPQALPATPASIARNVEN